MAKDAAKTRKILHPTKNDVKAGAEYLSSLSESERMAIYKARDSWNNLFCIFCALAFLSIPFLFFALWFT